MIRKGYYERYFITPFFREFRNTKGVLANKELTRTFVAWGIATLGIVGLLLGLVGLLGPEVGFVTLLVVGGLWLLWSLFCFVSVFVRCANAKRSGEEVKPRPVAMLGIDKLLSAVCILFFVLGMLMMITTLNSGELNMTTGTGQSDEDNPILNSDKVEEEAIFNYMNYDESAPEEEEIEVVDSTEAQEEFDPMSQSPAAVEDTTYIE